MPDVATIPPKPPPEPDPRFERTPKVRRAMILRVPCKDTEHFISITETANGGKVGIETGGLTREVFLNVRELRELATFANTIARIVSRRPAYKP